MKLQQMRVRRLLAGLVVVGGAAIILYFLVFKPVAVTSFPVTHGTVLVEALGTGSLESRRVVDLGFEVSGRVIRLNVDQGDTVTQGQFLAAIESKNYKAEVALAKQEVSLAESTLHRLDADIVRAKAVLDGALANLKRVRRLVEGNLSPDEHLDVAEEREKIARAELSRAQSAQIEGGQFVSTAVHRLDRAQAYLDQTVVESPFDGIVIRRDREVGDVAVPGSTVLKLAATDIVWASVWVDETYLESLAVGLPARIVLRSDPHNPRRGTVSRIGREVDRETRELLVDVSFDTIPEKLVFGQRVDLWIELARKSDVLTIPTGLLVHANGQEGVFLADGNRAKFKPVEIGKQGRENVEVVSGLSANDIVLKPFDKRNKRLTGGERIQLLDKDRNGGPE